MALHPVTRQSEVKAPLVLTQAVVSIVGQMKSIITGTAVISRDVVTLVHAATVEFRITFINIYDNRTPLIKG